MDEVSRMSNIENAFMYNLTNISTIGYTDLINKIKNIYILIKSIPLYSHIIYAYLDLYYTQLKKTDCFITSKTIQSFDDLIKKVRIVNKYSKLVEIMVDNPFEYRFMINDLL